MNASTAAVTIVLVAASVCISAERSVEVGNDQALRDALRQATPGTQIRIAPGDYRPGVTVHGLQGTAEAPIVIEGSDPERPPRFRGGTTGWHLIDCAHLTLRHLAVQGQSGNGLNVDDGGSYDTPSHHIVLEDLHVSDVGPRGNLDGIKLSGLDDFVVRRCHVAGWGGQAVDMVGCHRGLIEDCHFVGKPGFSQSTGPQTKGGSSEIVIRACRFDNAGQRAVNLGGSTGKPYFRPLGAKYEARNITVEGCTFVGSMAPIAFVGVEGAVVRYNTIVQPDKWVMRILQETRDADFAVCGNNRFERNLIVFRRAHVQVFVNVGPGTAPETFQFAHNFWYCQDRPQASRPQLPTPETGGIYGFDPKHRPADQTLLPTDPTAAAYGARALPSAK